MTPPALLPGQLSYLGVVFGGLVAGASSNLQSLQGRDLAAMNSGDTDRPLDHGQFVGRDTLSGRDIQIVEVVRGDTAAQLDAAIMQRGAIMAPRATDEQPLYMATNMGVFYCNARPRRHNFPWDINAFLANGIVVTSLFHATDPRWYAWPTKLGIVSLGGPVTGLAFPAAEPFVFGGGGGGFLSVSNDGAIDMRPRLEIDGPCTNPAISNISLPGAPTIKVNVTLNTGDLLVIDTDFQSVTLTVAGTVQPASRANATAGSTWWNLPANMLSQLKFSSDDAGGVTGRLRVYSADAWPVV